MFATQIDVRIIGVNISVTPVSDIIHTELYNTI